MMTSGFAIARWLISVAVLLPILAHGSEGRAGPSICESEDAQPVELVEPVEWCAVTTIAGSESGSVRMVLPQDVEFTVPRDADGVFLDFGPGTAIDVAGEGRLVGFAITEDPPAPGGILLLGGRVGVESDQVGEFFFDMSVGQRPCVEDACSVPSGAYRLHLLADDTPVRVTLRFQGLSGEVELGASAPLGGEVRDLQPHVEEQNGRTVLVAGEADEVVGEGAAIVALWLTRDAQVADAMTTCFYRGEVPEPVAYLPGCPWQDEGGFRSVFTGQGPSPHRETVMVLAGRSGPSDEMYALGASYATASLVQDWGAVAWWLDFDPDVS